MCRTPARSNFPMAIDRDAHRVLVVFRNQPSLMVLSSENGQVLSKVETCGDADDVFVDGKRHRVYVSCGEGVADVLERQRAQVPVGLQDPGQEIRQLLATVDDESIRPCDRTQLALAERPQLGRGVIVSFPDLVDELEQLGREEVDHVPVPVVVLDAVDLVGVGQHDHGGSPLGQ